MNPADHQNESIGCLAICGVGLIGGSIARAARSRGVVSEVIGIGKNQARLQKAVEQGVIDRGSTEPESAAAQADLIIICTPVDLIASQVAQMLPHMRDSATITDAGSVKGEIVRELQAEGIDASQYVPGHPLAGSDKTGFEFADPDLFEKATIVLTPTAETADIHTRRVRTFWQALGGNVLTMQPEEHDSVLAMTSHLPHLVAAALAAAVQEDHLRLASSGFRDSTRIAAGDPELWTSIFRQNAAATLAAAREFQEKLTHLITAIEQDNADELKALLAEGKCRRDAWREQRLRLES
ncbi:prephenate dehydrogenase [Rubinisphaera margarita]|uniref:prephenate dehydrogenase n=1 Tax=Rubinisphaera margarita TaxID=2909586 RepID=UPI001EE86E96|nr:prephenate dehydrogenase/arogenate dehydrogenase family protein [Rubinisphaera margarita]MCG6156124.1 prephenate dehydrogenase/arogenate dehydrogenase family protein [Rubinisphaera margarita]